MRPLLTTMLVTVFASLRLYGANLVADWYIHMTNGVIGDPITAISMSNGTAPSTLVWEYNAADGMGIGGHTNNLASPVQVGASVFPVDYPNHSLVWTNSFRFGSMAGDVFISERVVTVAGFVYLGFTNTASQSVADLVFVNGLVTGGGVSMQLKPGPTYQLNIESTPGGVTTHSDYMTVTPKTWYWFSLHADYNAGACSLYIFDTSAALIGHLSSTNSAGEDIKLVSIGQGESALSANNNCFEHILIAKGSHAIQPLGPAADHRNIMTGGTVLRNVVLQ